MAESFSYEQLIASGEGRLFDPDSGRLPLPPMLMFDRITHIDADGGAHGLGRIEAELDIKPDLWFFACHFQGDPVMPGTDRKFNRMRPSMARVLGLETRSAKEG